MTRAEQLESRRRNRWQYSAVLLAALTLNQQLLGDEKRIFTKPTADVAFEILDLALEKSWAEPDPREYLGHILRCAVTVDSARALDRVRAVAVRLGKESRSPERGSTFATLADFAAPHDRLLRDQLLRRAVAEARLALDDKELWQLKPDEGQDVEARNYLRSQRATEKQLLQLGADLWEAVAESARDRDKSLIRIKRLLTDAKAKEHFGTDRPASYEVSLLLDLADLDPELVIAVIEKRWKKSEVAFFCFERALERRSDKLIDSFTRHLITFAVDNGYVSLNSLDVFKDFDLDQAWNIAVKLPHNPSNSELRSGALCDIIREWSWRDPEAALIAAEKEPDDFERRQLITSVTKAWIYKKPNQIERAIRNLDNEYLRNSVRDDVAKELNWRKQGNPPHDTRAKVALAAQGRIPTGKGRREPVELDRILNNPKDTSWLHGSDRKKLLGWAGAVSYRETGKLEGIEEIIAGLKDSEEIDEVLCRSAECIAGCGKLKDCAFLAKRIRSSHRLFLTSMEVVRQLGHREDH